VGCMAQLLALTGPRHVDVHQEDEGAFRNACAKGQLPAVKLLLGLDGDRAVDANAKDNWEPARACCHGHLSVSQRLLAVDARRAVHSHWYGERALRGAAEWKQGACLRLLLAGHRPPTLP